MSRSIIYQYLNNPVVVSGVIIAISMFNLWQQLSIVLADNADSTYHSVVITSTFLIQISVMLLFLMMQTRSQIIEARDLAFRDDLTKLPNRRSFNEKLDKELVRASGKEKTLAVVFFDLDRFKTINDCHGHEVGDAVICEYGKRIASIIRGRNLVARLSGDEFAALIHNVSCENELQVIAGRVLEKMKQPVIYNDRSIYVGVSMGGVIIERGQADVAKALRMADLALLRSKDEGRGKLRVFDPQMAVAVQKKAQLETRLRSAIATESFNIRYLPTICRKSGKIAGVEALMRWHHEEAGEIPPTQFIALAEEMGLMDTLGEYVLRKGCRDLLSFEDLRLSINVSPAQFLQRNFVDTVSSILDETGYPPNRLELEVSERILISHPEEAKLAVRAMRQVGVQIALDDFGTGYTSIAYLKGLRLDRIKIDRSITKSIVQNDDDEQLFYRMIELGNTLGVNVTVEGIENERQLDLVSDRTCNELQGFLFSRPLSIEELADFGKTHGQVMGGKTGGLVQEITPVEKIAG